MKLYELTILISPELSFEEVNSLQEKIISLIQSEKGILIEQKKSVKKNLAYPVKKMRDSHLTTVDFQIEPANLGNLEKKIKEERQILRYLILTKEVKKMAEAVRKPSRFPKKTVKPKVELKEIEKKLEEILGET